VIGDVSFSYSLNKCSILGNTVHSDIGRSGLRGVARERPWLLANERVARRACDRGAYRGATLRGGRVRAYMAAPTIWLANHGVAATEEDMQALLIGAPRITKKLTTFLMPARRAALFRWCLTKGFRAIRPMTLMTIGEYSEPKGSYFPSVLY
jgi:hypothetical protein